MCTGADLQQSAVDAVLLEFGSWFYRKFLQQGLDGGWDLRDQDKGDKSPSCHFSGAIHSRAAASVEQRKTLVSWKNWGKMTAAAL